MSNYIFHQVEESIQTVLGYLMQDFGNSPTQISRFFGLGELYRQTVAATDQLWTWGFRHIKEHSKLHILSSGGVNPEGSWLFVAGVWEFPHTNFEIFSRETKFRRERLPTQTSYAHRGWYILKSMSRHIFYQEAGSF